MIYLKTPEEIELLRKSNVLVGKTLAEVAKAIKVGITTLELDKIAEDFIRSNGALPGFLGYQGFPNTLCISVNDQVVHGIPSNYALKDGDIVSVDCGTIIDGFYGDSAYTFCVGNVDPKVKKLLQTTKEALYKGIEQARHGNRLGDVGYAIQQHCQAAGFSVVREMVGHGIGRNMHEDPEVPNYGKRGQGIQLREGMVIAIEPMINMGNRGIVMERDGWTIRTIDRKPSAHFEHTVAIQKGDATILSTFEYVEEVLSHK
ncbi:MAG: type I methionyl aminopeptidase [Paludibacteraceae bacterium]|jgi:methionyl aminopeptidase|nr:type I methionyl aminopeptidase [Paludibacteraceae bacterium]MED9995814.1 type I methionyl aminopeptidase [Paludibacteraceae bacterium]